MRVSTALIQRTSVSNLMDLQAEIFKRDQQLSTGKRVLQASDDPLAISRINRSEQTIKLTEQYQKNVISIERHIKEAESVTGQYYLSINRVKELLVQAANTGISGGTDREAIALELEQMRDHIQGLANTKNADGDYIFSGFQSTQKPFEKSAVGRYSYEGDQGQRYVKVSTTSQVAVNLPGDEIFGGITAAIGSFKTAETSTNTGTGVVSLGTISDLAARQAAASKSYTITFNADNPGKNFDIVDDSASGTPLTGYNDKAYVAGDPIIIGGVTFSITGSPQPGDTFTLKPATKQDIFTTISDAADALRNETDDERLDYRIGNALENVDNAANVASAKQAFLGANLKTAQQQSEVNADIILTAQEVLAKIRDVDHAKVIPELVQLRAATEASQKVFSLMNSLSLFNFMP